MDPIVDALSDQDAELLSLLEGLDDAGWSRPSRCEGWTVADVVLHLAQTDAMALASARGSLPPVAAGAGTGAGAVTVDDGAARMVAQERGGSNAELLDRWRDGSAELRSTLRETDPHQRCVWVAGTLSARTLATTRLAEAWIHTGDVFDAFGVVPPATPRLRHIARLAWRTVPYAFARAGRQLSGPVAFELVGPDGDAWDFLPDEPPASVIRGPADELCLVAARRLDPAATSLRGEGPDAPAVLELVRTYA